MTSSSPAAIFRASLAPGINKLLLLMLSTLSLITTDVVYSNLVQCEHCKKYFDSNAYDKFQCPHCQRRQLNFNPSPPPPPDPDGQAGCIRHYLEVSRGEKTNTVTSPVCLASLLEILKIGASPEAIIAINQWQARHGFADFAATAASGVFCSSQCLLVSRDYPLSPQYQQDLQQSRVVCHEVEFDDREAVKQMAQEVNREFAKLTNNLVPEAYSPDDTSVNTIFAALAVIYFTANWTVPFEAMEVVFQPFGADRERVPGMAQELSQARYASFWVGPGKFWQATSIAAMGGTEKNDISPPADPGDAISATEMIVVLPPRGMTPDDATFEIIDYLINSLTEVREVKLIAPVFTSRRKIKKMLEVLLGEGLGVLFDKGYMPFARMFQNPAAAVLDLLQIETVVHANPKGMEAAACATVTYACASSPGHVTVYLDHPFIFIIRHASTHQIYFIGNVYDP